LFLVDKYGEDSLSVIESVLENNKDLAENWTYPGPISIF
jgi:hypothetical protein